MGANDGAIQDQPFQVGFTHELLMHRCPNAALVPAGKAFVNTIPVAVFFGQQAPLRTAAGHLEDRFQELPRRRLIPDINLGTGFEKGIQFVPS
jgi:hypothetical protein